MDILEKARKLESAIAQKLDHAARRVMQSGAREPLEIKHAIVDTVAKEVVPAGRGKRLFPFNAIKVSVVAPTPDLRARFDAVFDADPSLHERIVERLRAAGIEPSRLIVKAVHVSQPEPHWTNREFHVSFTRVLPAVEVIAPAHAAPLPTIGLTIVQGSAERPEYSFSLARIDLGRCAEVRDSRNRLIRTNDVVFTDAAGEMNQSVSRQHAHIEYLARSDEYRVYDDRSAHGTAVVRNGRSIAVPSGSRGIRLQSGDEIVLGEARLRVAL
jgi:hypothetical protein